MISAVSFTWTMFHCTATTITKLSLLFSKILSGSEYGLTNVFKLGKRLYFSIEIKEPIMKAKMLRKLKWRVFSTSFTVSRGLLQHEKGCNVITNVWEWLRTRRTTSEQSENQQQTQPNNDAWPKIWTWVTLMEGERSHHCTIPALLGCGREKTKSTLSDRVVAHAPNNE